MSLPIIMHVNYCEQGQTIPEMCRKAVGWGYDGIEFRRYRRGVEETTEQYLDTIAAGRGRLGVEARTVRGPRGGADAGRCRRQSGAGGGRGPVLPPCE